MCLNGVKLHAFLLEVSRLLEEAIAQDDDPREPAYEPGGARHVPVDKAGDTARDGRWTRWVKWSTRSTRSLGRHDHSWLAGKAAANALNPKGHGADWRRKGGIEPKVYLLALLEDAGAKKRIKEAIAAAERDEKHLANCVRRKRQCHATYDMIAAYRDLFLVKHEPEGDEVPGGSRFFVCVTTYGP